MKTALLLAGISAMMDGNQAEIADERLPVDAEISGEKQKGEIGYGQ